MTTIQESVPDQIRMRHEDDALEPPPHLQAQESARGKEQIDREISGGWSRPGTARSFSRSQSKREGVAKDLANRAESLFQDTDWGQKHEMEDIARMVCNNASEVQSFCGSSMGVCVGSMQK